MRDTDYYISDLHLAPDTPGTNQLFFRFLDRDLADARSLTINGDFLEAYSGFKQLRVPFVAVLMEALGDLVEGGLVVRFVSGNRDFLLAKDCYRYGVEGHEDFLLIPMGHKALAVIHGDSFCLDDRAYLRFRWLVRTVPFHWLNFVTTPRFGQRISGRMRAKSKARHAKRVAQGTPAAYYDIKDEAVLAFLERTGASTVICGHIHQPQERVYPASPGSIERETSRRMLILGDWHEDGAVIAVARGDGEPELCHLTKDGVERWPHEILERKASGG